MSDTQRDQVDNSPIDGQITLEGFRAATRKLAQEVQEPLKGVRMSAGALSDSLKPVKTLADILNSEPYQRLKRTVEALKTLADRIHEVKANNPTIRELAPFISVALDEAQDNEQFTGITLQSFIDQAFYTDGTPKDGECIPVIERAAQLKREYTEAESVIGIIEQAAEELPQITAIPIETLMIPLDKANSALWSFPPMEGFYGNKESAFVANFDTKKKGTKQPAKINYAIYLLDEAISGATITSKLTSTDKFIYIAVDSLYREGNQYITTNQIYRAMGGSGDPNREQKEKINRSLTKMGSSRVYINNAEEIAVNKGYPPVDIDTPLLVFTRMRISMNSTPTEAIFIHSEPFLMAFARKRGQITSIPVNLLKTPLSITDGNLQLQDYLLSRISHIKNPKNKIPKKLNFETIFEACHITGKTERERKERQRVPDKVRKCLDTYKASGWITGYKLDKDSVIITV